MKVDKVIKRLHEFFGYENNPHDVYIEFDGGVKRLVKSVYFGREIPENDHSDIESKITGIILSESDESKIDDEFVNRCIRNEKEN